MSDAPPPLPTNDKLLAVALDRSQTIGERISALWKIKARNDRGLVACFLRLFEDASESPELRSVAAFQAAYTGPARRVRGALMQAARTEPDLAVRKSAVEAAAHLGTKRVIFPLLDILDDRSETAAIRAEAAHSVGMNLYGGTSRISRKLIPHLFDPDPRVRFYTMYALAMCGKKRALPALRTRVNDYTDSGALWWSNAQEARWAINTIRLRGRYIDTGDPEDPIYKTNAWKIRPERRGKVR
jgi:HEAT repeat protein